MDEEEDERGTTRAGVCNKGRSKVKEG